MPEPLYYYEHDGHHFVSVDGKQWQEFDRRPTAGDRQDIADYFRGFDGPPEMHKPTPLCLTDRYLHLYAGYTPDEAERI